MGILRGGEGKKVEDLESGREWGTEGFEGRMKSGGISRVGETGEVRGFREGERVKKWGF